MRLLHDDAVHLLHLYQHALRSFVQVESMDAIIEEELVRDGESDNIQSIDVVAFNKL